MACIYNEEIFLKFRTLAVTDVSDIKIGETYYSNSYPEVFTVREIISWKELDERRGITNGFSKDTKLQWIVYGTGEHDACSLSDRNVNNSYNPWMIFKNAEDCDHCKKELVVTYSAEPYDDFDAEDYDYPYDE